MDINVTLGVPPKDGKEYTLMYESGETIRGSWEGPHWVDFENQVIAKPYAWYDSVSLPIEEPPQHEFFLGTWDRENSWEMCRYIESCKTYSSICVDGSTCDHITPPHNWKKVKVITHD